MASRPWDRGWYAVCFVAILALSIDAFEGSDNLPSEFGLDAVPLRSRTRMAHAGLQVGEISKLDDAATLSSRTAEEPLVEEVPPPADPTEPAAVSAEPAAVSAAAEPAVSAAAEPAVSAAAEPAAVSVEPAVSAVEDGAELVQLRKDVEEHTQKALSSQEALVPHISGSLAPSAVCCR